MSEIVVDNFAGGGGASTGIEMAIGRSVDIAINHDPAAIAMHRANHPTTEHYQEDVWKVNPVKACAGRPVALAWFSPDCKHHSRAKGGKPVSILQQEHPYQVTPAPLLDFSDDLVRHDADKIRRCMQQLLAKIKE